MKLFTSFWSVLLLLLCLSSSVQSQEFDGYALYNELNNNTTYLIDKNGDIAHTWSLNRPCNYAVLLMETGNIMRGAVNPGNQINGAAVGGMVQEVDPQGNVVWEFVYSSSDYVAHHDITLMPDGNVLLTAWEVKTQAELQEMGYTGNSNVRYPTHFIEVSQNGTGGEIVWEWHIWDHLIQDVDPNKPNFGVIAEHPELLDINVPTGGGPGGGGGGPGGGGGDWFHVNGVNYNAELDQITFSSRYLSEVFIIDHSTTTAEAAGHTGGNAGKGGDFLYRWGNPSNYDTNGPTHINGPVHDARFITDDGRPRGGFLQFFNNDGGGNTSTIDAIELPRAADGYNYERAEGQAYGPEAPSFRHVCLDEADGQSASNSMPNGNVFVALSREYMYEVDANGELVWQYNAGPAKAFRYTCDHPGIQVLVDQGVIEDLCMISDVDEVLSASISIAPNPSSGIFNIEGLLADNRVKNVQVLDVLGQKISDFGAVNQFDLSAYGAGVYFVQMELVSGQVVAKKVSVIK